MIQANVTSFEQQDALWRMLCYVPDAEFQSVAVFRDDRLQHIIIRQNGEQTAVRAADHLVHNDQAPAPVE